MQATGQIKELLRSKGLKATPQRIIVLEAIRKLNNHPTAEQIFRHISRLHPSISKGTVYRILEVLNQNQLVKMVKTEKGLMRYDGIPERHHHLYSSETNRIEDFIDDELDALLEGYFKNKKLENFEIEDIVLNIKGRFLSKGNIRP